MQIPEHRWNLAAWSFYSRLWSQRYPWSIPLHRKWHPDGFCELLWRPRWSFRCRSVRQGQNGNRRCGIHLPSIWLSLQYIFSPWNARRRCHFHSRSRWSIFHPHPHGKNSPVRSDLHRNLTHCIHDCKPRPWSHWSGCREVFLPSVSSRKHGRHRCKDRWNRNLPGHYNFPVYKWHLSHCRSK